MIQQKNIFNVLVIGPIIRKRCELRSQSQIPDPEPLVLTLETWTLTTKNPYIYS
jgi:hypothetical protein